MTGSCADLELFFDGELSNDAAAAFREHLVSCERCQIALSGRMQEEVVAGTAYERVKQPSVAAVKPVHLEARRRRIAYLAPILAAAAALAIWLVSPPEDQAKAIEVSLAIEHHGSPTRSSEHHGDPMRVSVAHVADVLRPTVRGEAYLGIWVYLNDRDLVVACPGGAACGSADGGLTLEFSVPAPGQYSIIAIVSQEPIIAAHGPPDVMLSVVTAHGAQLRIQRVDVD
jgi:hypothetical protein